MGQKLNFCGTTQYWRCAPAHTPYIIIRSRLITDEIIPVDVYWGHRLPAYPFTGKCTAAPSRSSRPQKAIHRCITLQSHHLQLSGVQRTRLLLFLKGFITRWIIARWPLKFNRQGNKFRKGIFGNISPNKRNKTLYSLRLWVYSWSSFFYNLIIINNQGDGESQYLQCHIRVSPFLLFIYIFGTSIPILKSVC